MELNFLGFVLIILFGLLLGSIKITEERVFGNTIHGFPPSDMCMSGVVFGYSVVNWEERSL